MAEQKISEKREYVRADLTTRVKIQQVSRQEFEQIKTMQTGIPLDGTCPDETNIPDGPMGHLFRRMAGIEEKVDQILAKLDPESRSDEGVKYGTSQNVSGVGIKLSLDEEMEAGQLVLISLSVPGFSIGFLQAYGEVIRVVPKEDMGRQSFDTSIKFLIINETEREKLISYAFFKQRQAIRGLTMAKKK
jgi:c-di-GMP-binding flagellar brake protein YcgR